MVPAFAGTLIEKSICDSPAGYRAVIARSTCDEENPCRQHKERMDCFASLANEASA